MELASHTVRSKWALPLLSKEVQLWEWVSPNGTGLHAPHPICCNTIPCLIWVEYSTGCLSPNKYKGSGCALPLASCLLCSPCSPVWELTLEVSEPSLTPAKGISVFVWSFSCQPNSQGVTLNLSPACPLMNFHTAS